MHPLERAFLDDIIENPDDDAPRLIYADWLSDQGREERAEFIRVQIGGDDPDFREIELLEQHGPDWAAPLAALFGFRQPRATFGYGGGAGFQWEWCRGFIYSIRCPLQSWLDHGREVVGLHPVRRVVATDKEPGTPAIMANDPRRGWYSLKAYGAAVAAGNRDEIQHAIWKLLNAGRHGDTFWKLSDDDAAARSDLSDALIRFARRPNSVRQ